MDLKRIIQKTYGISLPITNGSGENNSDAIKLIQVGKFRSSKIEQQVLDMLMDIQGYTYSFISLENKAIKNLRYDVITIEVRFRYTSESHIQDIWFDVSDCTDNYQHLGSDIADSKIRSPW